MHKQCLKKKKKIPRNKKNKTKKHAQVTYWNKFLKADPVVLVFVPLGHQLLDDLTDFVPRKGQVGLFEQVVELVVIDVAITVQICRTVPFRHSDFSAQFIMLSSKKGTTGSIMWNVSVFTTWFMSQFISKIQPKAITKLLILLFG